MLDFLNVRFVFFLLGVSHCRHLWVGCTGSIKIVDLLTLSLVKIVEIPIDSNATTPAVVMVRSVNGT